jgi:ubiquinone/menaquinone biosynthesis C-methylase UbiE
MPVTELKHELRLPLRRDEKARAAFVSGLRRYVFNELASGLRRDYVGNAESAWRARYGRIPQTGEQAHQALRHREYFRFYSCLRVTSQDMLYQTVRAAIEREQAPLISKARQLAGTRCGSLTLQPGFAVPRSVSAVDIHLMPGSYDTEYCADDLTMGAVYENRLALSTFGIFGPNLDDIGQSIARFVRARYPAFAPRKVLDLGCTVGHNTGAWKDIYPEAQVHGIDVAAPCLRYGLARAQSQGRELHLHQMNAEALDFPDASFDVVFSSMFLHEVPRKGIGKVLGEAHRVLRPGGLMLHMELPPASQLSAYDSFYLDWDGRYNHEPFYQAFRAQDPRALVRKAGFRPQDYLQFVVPSISALGERGWREALATRKRVGSDKTGRLAEGVRWYCFGAWKRER